MQNKRKRSLTRGAALMVLLVLMSGCGGQAAPSAPTPAASAGSQSGSAPTIVATTAVDPNPTAAADNAATQATPTTAAAASTGNASSGPGMDLTGFDVCSLLTHDEILGFMPQVVFKDSLVDFDPKSGTKTCTFADGDHTGYLQLSLYTPNRWDDEAKIIGDSPQPVSGLGDEAVTQALKYADVLAVLVKGKAAFLLTVNLGLDASNSPNSYDAKQSGAAAMQFAKNIIPRLK